jgi:hypothetical protein
MLIEDNKPQKEPRPPRGFSATAPPGFALPEGRSFILVAGDRIGRFVKRRLEALRAIKVR